MNPDNVRVVATIPAVVLWLLACGVGLVIWSSKRPSRWILVAVFLLFSIAGVTAIIGVMAAPFYLMFVAVILLDVDAYREWWETQRGNIPTRGRIQVEINDLRAELRTTEKALESAAEDVNTLAMEVAAMREIVTELSRPGRRWNIG